jgi:hypothetical protein
LWTRQWTFGFRKRWEISWLAEWLLAYPLVHYNYFSIFLPWAPYDWGYNNRLCNIVTERWEPTSVIFR